MTALCHEALSTAGADLSIGVSAKVEAATHECWPRLFDGLLES
jgi:hypothetical protein